MANVLPTRDTGNPRVRGQPAGVQHTHAQNMRMRSKTPDPPSAWFDNETYGEVNGVGGNGCNPLCFVKLYRTYTAPSHSRY
jgi:hypothetical protein